MKNSDNKCIHCKYLDTNDFCRRFPPQVIYSGKDRNLETNYITTFGVSMYPKIRIPNIDWCGEFSST